MEHNYPQEPDPNLETQSILLAASHHNLESLRTLLRTGSANVQDSDTGSTPLHAAIAACEVSSPPSPATNGHASNGECNEIRLETDRIREKELESAAKTVRLLLQNGAIWNDLDKNDETPGCLARSLGLDSLYEIMVDAGVRAEMLMNRLDGYQLLRENDDGGEEDDEAEAEEEQVLEHEFRVADSEVLERAEGLHESTQDTLTEDGPTLPASTLANPSITNATYLQTPLVFQASRLLDQDTNGVMMSWETNIMQKTANLLAPSPNLRILNIGHGMGIIDDFFQAKAPSAHHIIEAHPTVLTEMKKNGWYEKPNVTIHEQRWQDALPLMLEGGLQFDAIYFDTFAESYGALRDFFSEHVIGLLDDAGKWGFFHGLGADRQICYDVYTKVVEMDLFEAGYEVEWETVEVPDLEKGEDWKGVKRKYWALEQYRLPVCTFLG
ncbi:Arginine N-methyltransferase 2 [Schaereria dolodes]|nr:Arginine N-methyltransferase 2 [Schaereria dolodes]